jgi:3-hydroxyacyl-[acyl-carrier-protein] dehydratase
MQLLTNNLYTVKQLDEDRWEVVLDDENHPVFKAHFENYPLLPAFLQIDIFSEILSKHLVKIERAKFKLPILPNDKVIYEVVKQIEKSYRVKITKEGQVTSEIKVVYA